MNEEQKEKKYLKDLLQKVDQRLIDIDDAIDLKKEEIDYMNNHMQEHKRDMDHLEKNAMRETIYNYTLQGEHSVDTKKRLFRLKDTAYFGRIDFTPTTKKTPDNIYIGVSNFQDTKGNKNLVYDWRAPISSLFYDFELGSAQYASNNGKIEGEIDLKRQFRIRKGEMEYMIDTDLTIHDDVLQRELNQASSDKMRNIVATIQKEQNEIIRNEEARHLIIQGVAGSGKTSIALHRIAFLLYNFKDTITSEDILIISPNKVFASYISNVLPELGEQSVAETSMEEIAAQLFEYQIKFQGFFDQVTELLEKNNPDLIKRIQFKSSSELLIKMDEYLVHLENDGLKVENITIAKKLVPDWFVKESFQKYHRLPISKRFNEVVRDIVDNVFFYYKYQIQGKERTELHKMVRNMFPSTNLRMLYKGFYAWMDKSNLLKMRKGSTFEWSDVYPLLYLKMKVEGLASFNEVKHLVIDEMQDYSVVQYKVLSTLYPCKKTILGDINQSVNPFSSSNLETITKVFPDATTMTMLKSYRSTYEITKFSMRVNKNADVEAIERHGKAPAIVKVKDQNKQLETVNSWIKGFEKSDYNSLGIICKTQKQAETIYNSIPESKKAKLLSTSSSNFNGGVIITTAHLAKGLEFDHVVVPFCDDKNYQHETDRQMLYVACTRAMHELNLCYIGKLTSFLD